MVIQNLKHPEFWVITSVVLILPPAYFWFWGLLDRLGVDLSVATDLLLSLPTLVAMALVYWLPFPALLTSYVSYRKMHNGLTLLLLLLSIGFTLLSVIAISARGL